MAGILKIAELEAKRRALVAESEIYRQTLIVQVQNLRLYSVRARHRLRWFSPKNPWMMLAAPLVAAFLKRVLSGGAEKTRTRAPRWRWLSWILIGWRLYQRFSPLLTILLAQRRSAGTRAGRYSEETFPDATI